MRSFLRVSKTVLVHAKRHGVDMEIINKSNNECVTSFLHNESNIDVPSLMLPLNEVTKKKKSKSNFYSYKILSVTTSVCNQ